MRYIEYKTHISKGFSKILRHYGIIIIITTINIAHFFLVFFRGFCGRRRRGLRCLGRGRCRGHGRRGGGGLDGRSGDDGRRHDRRWRRHLRERGEGRGVGGGVAHQLTTQVQSTPKGASIGSVPVVPAAVVKSAALTGVRRSVVDDSATVPATCVAPVR